jgi:hypothetical protein
MSENGQVISLLTRIEENQRTALDVQQRQLELTQAQLERSNQSVRESLELQRVAVSRQSQITKLVLPLIGVLLLLLAYLLVKWRIL